MASEGRPRGTAVDAYVPELDGIRGIAIIAVIAVHFIATLLPEPHNLLESIAGKITGYGMWGVDLFFVLSGYLITGILSDSRTSPRYFKAFYMRRTLRIFPLYYGVLFLLMVVIPRSLLEAYVPDALEMRRVQGWLWTYLSNVYCAKQGSFAIPYVSHFWTLAIEEHFYLFWPLVIKIASRTNAMRIALGLSVMALGLRLVLSHTQHEMWAQVFTLARLDSLCIGAWFALAIRGPDGMAAIGRNLKTWLLASSAALILLIVTPKSLIPHELNLPLKESALAVLCGAFIFAAAWSDGPPRLKAALRFSGLRLFGKYSYGLYVFHAILSYAAWRYSTAVYLEPFLAGSHTAAILLQFVLGTALSLLIAMASYHFYEVRFLALKKWFKA